jgi:hypothetical protein
MLTEAAFKPLQATRATGRSHRDAVHVGRVVNLSAQAGINSAVRPQFPPGGGRLGWPLRPVTRP